MPISGLGTISSGLGGISPQRTNYAYVGKSAVYNIPIDLNAGTKNNKSSATDDKSSVLIVENQLIGISKTHALQNVVAVNGLLLDQSSPTSNIVSLSGIEAYINNVYVGNKNKVYSWSGLASTGTNFLWVSLVEQPTSTFNFKSSRIKKEFECRSTPDINKPVGPEDSVLVATYTSGIGININPPQKFQFQWLSNHTTNNQRPHGNPLYVNGILVSGLQVLRPAIWNNSAASGAPSGIPYSNITYNTNLTQYGNMVTSGGTGLLLSGNNVFPIPIKLGVNFASVGYLTVVSGNTITSSIFRRNMTMGSGIPIDNTVIKSLLPLVSITCLSGNPVLHSHSLNVASGISLTVSPRYPGCVFNPYVYNNLGQNGSITQYDNNTQQLGQNATVNRFEINTDLNPIQFKPTLRHKASANSDTDYCYVRTFMPQFYNTLESISIEYKIDSGISPITLQIRDGVGSILTPLMGNNLSSSGFTTQVVSGFPQGGFGQNLPVDIEMTFNSISGLNHYAGDISYNFKVQ